MATSSVAKPSTTPRSAPAPRSAPHQVSGRTAQVQRTREAQIVRQQQVVQQINVIEGSIEKKKMTGFVFYLILLLALVKDLFDIILGVTLILDLLVIPISFAIDIIIAIYFFVSGVNPSARKIGYWATDGIIDAIPEIDMLPMTTFAVVTTRLMENREIKTHNRTKREQIAGLRRQLA